MGNFLEENKAIKILLFAVIIFSIYSFYSTTGPKGLVDELKILSNTQNNKSLSLEDKLEKRLDQIDAKHLSKKNTFENNNHNKKGNLNCPEGTTETKEEDKEHRTKFVYCIDEYSIKEGPFANYSSGGSKIQEGYFVNGRLDGKLSNWTKSANKSEEITYVNGEKNGKYTAWFLNGKIQIEGEYLSDQKNGVWKYYDAEGKIISLFEMAYNLKNGKVENYYNNGKLEFDGTYKNDKQEGKWSFYKKDGSLQTQGEFLNGRKVGKWIDYGLDGKPFSEKDYSQPPVKK